MVQTGPGPFSPMSTGLSGGGEMGELHRAFPWEKTSLGPIEAWPQSLQTAVSIMLRSHFGMYIAWGPEFLQFYNDAYRPILGSTKHPALGKSSRETFAESWHIIGPLFEDVMRGKAVGSEDWMLPLDRHGFLEECYFTFSYSPISAESGAVGGVLVTVTETTRRVLGERRLRTLRDLAARAQAATEEAEAWRAAAEVLRANALDLPGATLLALSEDGDRLVVAQGDVAPVDRDGLAARALRSRGLCEGASADAPPTRDAPWPEPLAHAVAVPIERPGARPYGVLWTATSPRLAFDPDYRSFLSLVAQQIATAIGNARVHDEERRRAEALAELDRAKTEFFSNVSHEFRTPLTLQLGPLEDLLARAELPEDVRASVSVAHRNGLRLLKLVNTLLDFSRLESGRAQADHRECDLGEVTAGHASVFRAAIERAGLAYEVDAPSMPGFWVDPDLWEKVVLNLVSNAFKFTRSGRVAVRLREEGGHAVLEVEDTGQGIPAADLAHIFERFHRVRGSSVRTHEGSGIGLALVQGVVKLHGGSIEVRSREGEGSTFTVRIPKGGPHLANARANATKERSAKDDRRTARGFAVEAERWLDEDRTRESPVRAGSATVLVVDDNVDMRDYLGGILSPRWRVVTAKDGVDALRVLGETEVDVIVCDVMMPRMDGLELLKEVRASPAWRETPFIVLSARAGPEASAMGLDAGADDYLVKPFSALEIVARVKANLALANLRRAQSRRVTSVLETISDAFFAVDHQWRLTYLNQRAHAIFCELAPARETFIGEGLWDVFPPDWAEPFHALYHEAMEQGVVKQLEALHTPSGRWFDVTAYPTPEGLSVYNRDITDRKLQERRLATLSQLGLRVGLATSLEETYDSALEAICTALGTRRASILLFDDDGVMRFKAAVGISASYRDDVEGHSPWKPTDRDAAPLLVEDVRADESLRPHLATFERERIASLGFFPLQYGNWVIGKFMVYFDEPHTFLAEEVQTAQAVAGMVSAAIARRQAEEALRRSEGEFRALSESLPQMVWALDERGEVEYQNERAGPYSDPLDAAFMGLTLDEDDEESRAAWRERFANAQAFAREVCLRRADGAGRWHLVHVAPLLDEDGEPVRWLGTATDIQDLRDAQEDVARSRRDIARSERLSALGSLVSGVAHEIRTPLTIIENNTHVLERRVAKANKDSRVLLAPEDVRAPVSEIRIAVERANNLVGELRKFTKLEMNKRVVVDLAQVAVEALQLLHATRKGEANVELCEEESATILADPSQVQQIVLNLVANALDATAEGPGRVRVWTRASDREAELVVEDDGHGMSLETQKRLFEPLFTTKPEGMGLGLSIVKRIVDDHGGTIACESEIGKGARFVVRFPLHARGP